MIEVAPIDTTTSMANKNPQKPKTMSKQQKTVAEYPDGYQNELPKRNYNGWKRPDINYQYQEEYIIPDESYVLAADTSIDGLLNAGVTPQLSNNYSGDIVDLSYISTADISKMRKAINGEVSALKAEFDTIKRNEKSAAELLAKQKESGGNADTDKND